MNISKYKIKDFENCENTEKLLAKKVSETPERAPDKPELFPV